MSLKWKLSISLVFMSLGFVGLYVLLAKRTFEADKISYIFDSQQRQVSTLAQDFNSHVERTIFDARSILASYDFSLRQLNKVGQKLFWTHPDILALSLYKDLGREPLISLEKSPGLLAKLNKGSALSGVQFSILDNKHFAVSITDQQLNVQSSLYIIFKVSDPLGQPNSGQILAMLTPKNWLKRTGELILSDPDLRLLLEQVSTQYDSTHAHYLDGKKFLVSYAKSKFGDIGFVSMVPETIALGALNVLFRRSVLFLLFSFFATVVISLLLSNQLTQNINSLTQLALKIGGGDFQSQPSFASKDEVGVLAQAFRKMTAEIQRLLADTVEKTRFEDELKTASLVQESLFPRETSFEYGQIRLCGKNKSTTEVGGDWWFYYLKDQTLYIYIADATGHGVPAALITAAARSLFSYLQDTHSSLADIADKWDKAVYECSNSKVYMTAFLVTIDVVTGEMRFINAGHEPQIVSTINGDKLKSTYVAGKQNHALGERHLVWKEDSLFLEPGSKVILFTDGLLAITSKNGKSFSEKRFLSLLDKNLSAQSTAQEIVSFIDKTFSELGEGQTLPDDVTFIAIEFNGNAKT